MRFLSRPMALRSAWWVVAAALATIAGAQWLRDPAIRYVVLAAAATAAAALLIPSLPRDRRRWPVWAVGALALFSITGAWAQRELWRVDRDWDSFVERTVSRGAAVLTSEIETAARAVERSAQRALDAPADPEGAFRHLGGLTGGTAEQGVVLHRHGQPVSWAGVNRVATDTSRERVYAIVTEFYVSLAAAARRGTDIAVAQALLYAEPPADRLSFPLERAVARHMGIRAFDIDGPALDPGPGGFRFAYEGEPLLTIRPLPLLTAETRLRLVERARVRGAAVLALALIFFLAGLWRLHRRLLPRFAALGVVVLCIAIVPLNELSNVTRLFSPAIYFAPLGGPFTASVGALGLTSAVVLLGLLAALRAPVRFRSRTAAMVAVLLVAGLGPYLLRGLARGINPPTWGVSIGLWLGWQVPLFLAAVSVLLAGASAGRAALGPGPTRGISPWLAPAVALLAALLGPVLWEAPGQWPDWYAPIWIAAIAALAVARRDRRSVLVAAVVASLGAMTLVWGATARQRVDLAARDVAGLYTPDAGATFLLERFADDLADDPMPVSRAELLRRYVVSDLALADFPVEISAWPTPEAPVAELRMAQFEPRRDDVRPLVAEAAATGLRDVVNVPGFPGTRLLLAQPHADGGVTAVVVEPRTRLIPDDPFAVLLGVAPERAREPPYTLTLTEFDAPVADLPREDRWTRQESELHGDWVIPTPAGDRRVHVEVELRTLDALVQRGTLVLLVDLAIIGALWLLSVVADGGYGRWLSARRRQWARSYRARLSLVLFLFFIVPAFSFAAWAYRRLQADDRQARELLVRETLRAVAASGETSRLGAASARFGSPLLLYSGGRLVETSDELYDALAPTGRLLPPDVYLALAVQAEVTATTQTDIGGTPTLFGYRATAAPTGGRAVLAAPAPTNELVLDRRRRDLGVLVLFATVVGGFAALWLSGVAAREFARPIGTLRRAALAVARGDREPPLDLAPPSEFQPVFSAFRQMAGDLSASRSALEEAQRRTAAILRNVASGVVAVDREAVVSLANPRASLVLESPLHEGMPLARAGAPALVDAVREFLTGGEDEREIELELAERRLHVRLTRLSRASGGAVVTLDDVTELARAERVLAWGEMARQIAHEIKNPLTPIRLGVQHLRRAHGDGRPDFPRVLDQNVKRILEEIDRLDEIARAFSRYGMAPAERAETQAIDVAHVVRDIVHLETMGEGRIRWITSGADEPAMAWGRADELREVLLNVLENARHANAHEVAVSVGRRDGEVCIAVRDDGEGIPPDVLPRIFEPHFSTRTSGSGLGLAISRRIVDSWGGSIVVRSERGAGAEVEIVLRSAEPRGAAGADSPPDQDEGSR